MKPILWLRSVPKTIALTAAALAVTAATAAEADRRPATDQPRPDRPPAQRPRRDLEQPPAREARQPEAVPEAPSPKPPREQLAPPLRRLQQVTEALRQARQDFRAAALEGRPEPQLRKLAQRVAELETERMLLAAQAMRKAREQAPPAVRQWLGRRRWVDGGAGPAPWAWGPPPTWRPGPWAGGMERRWGPPWQAQPQPPADWYGPRYPRMPKRDLARPGPGRFDQPQPPKPPSKLRPAAPDLRRDQPAKPPKAIQPDKPKDKPKAKPESKPAKKLEKKPKDKPKAKDSKPKR